MSTKSKPLRSCLQAGRRRAFAEVMKENEITGIN
jgi:hypothetical protein